MTFRTVTPSNSLLWDITLDLSVEGAIAVICQRKAPIPGKRQVCSLHITLYVTVDYSCMSVFLLLGNLSPLIYLDCRAKRGILMHRGLPVPPAV